jgi:hypothetical protein
MLGSESERLFYRGKTGTDKANRSVRLGGPYSRNDWHQWHHATSHVSATQWTLFACRPFNIDIWVDIIAYQFDDRNRDK